MNLDALLDGGFDALADKPEFKPFPAGVHGATIHLKQKQFGDKGKDGAGYEVKFKYQENVELTNPEDAIPKVGAETSLQLNLTSTNDLQRESSQGNLKQILAAGAAKFPELKSVRELIEAIEGAGVIITSSIRANKKEPGSAGYFQLDNIEFA